MLPSPSVSYWEASTKVGTLPSIMIASLAPNEFVAAGATKVRVATFAFEERSFIVPLFKAKEFVAL